MGDNPSWHQKGKGGEKKLPNYDAKDYPVEQVSYEDVQKFCDRLNTKYAGRLPRGYRFNLPTQAQWEYAARGGNTSKGHIYSGSNTCSEVARYYENSGTRRLDDDDWESSNLDENKCRTHPVKSKASNELGFYDMSGNVWEWCHDRSYDSYCVIRGGGWNCRTRNCRVVHGGNHASMGCDGNLGFRLALVPVHEP